MASANDFVMSCGLVIAEPTTAQNAPNSKTLFNFSGVLIFPSAITGWFYFGKGSFLRFQNHFHQS
mgnify:CR=1 FL=1